MRHMTRPLVPLLLLALPSAAWAWPDVAVSGGLATVSGTATQGTWQSWSPIVTADVTFRGGWSEVWAGAATTALVGPTDDGGVVPLSALGTEIGVGLGVPLFTAGVYGGWGWPGGTLGVYGRVMVPSANAWSDRIGIEGRLMATTATDAAGGALMLRVEPTPYRTTRAPARSRAAERAPAPPPPEPTPEPAREPTPEPPPAPTPPTETGHHDDPYGN